MYYMIVTSLIEWWYGKGWKSANEHAQKRIQGAYRMFSIPILVRTLFSPWRRIITAPGAGLDAHIRAAVDNLVSRVVGFVVRSMVLFVAMVTISVSTVVSILEVVIWPIVPIATPLLIVAGVIL
jgi:hypothetical protein